MFQAWPGGGRGGEGGGGKGARLDAGFAHHVTRHLAGVYCMFSLS